MNYQDTLTRLGEMKSRFDAGFSLSDRGFLDDVHYALFGKIITLTGCGDCYRDAYLLILHKLKSLGQMPKKANYILKPDALIHFFGEAEYYTLSVPDKVAERYLKQDKSNISQFQTYPNNWESRISKNAPKEESANDVKDAPQDDETSEVNNDTPNIGTAPDDAKDASK